MRLLLDTHIFLWAVSSSTRLTAASRVAITEPANEVFVSAVTAWEMAIKVSVSRLNLTFPLERTEQIVAEMGFEVLGITMPHCLNAGSLPRHHQDPFDRLLISQAQLEGLTLVTQDRQITQYDVPIYAG